MESSGQFAKATVNLGGRNFPVELLTDLGAEITREYETIKPKIIGAALTRMIARAAAAEGARALARKKGSGAALLATPATEASLVGLDKPDTRSWTFLPALIYVCRAKVPSGLNEIRVGFIGRIQETGVIQVDVPQGGYSIVLSLYHDDANRHFYSTMITPITTACRTCRHLHNKEALPGSTI